ncbi:MAG: hypothetical protein EXR79_17250 [Myxococcales bacterium]|nr:hypothetical protein [Myxococcales bacterium]
MSHDSMSRRKRGDAQGLAATIRNHGRIENTLHGSLDVTFGEDAHRIVNRDGATNLSRLRWLAHGTVKNATGYGMSMTRVCQVCGWNPDRLLDMLGGHVIAGKPKRRVLDPKRFKSMKTKSSTTQLQQVWPSAVGSGGRGLSIS